MPIDRARGCSAGAFGGLWRGRLRRVGAVCSCQCIGAHVMQLVEIAEDACIEVCWQGFVRGDFICERRAETAEDADRRCAEFAGFAARSPNNLAIASPLPMNPVHQS
jgi:hypothetical protein